MKSVQEEKWRPVPGYEGYYEVSDRGGVRSLTRTFLKGDGRAYTTRGRVLAPLNVRAYRRVGLSREGSTKQFSVHRLVALAFLGNSTGPLVRHLDGDPHNNVVTNLAFGTLSDNYYDMIRHGRCPKVNQTHCKWGHLFDEGNTYYSQDGTRGCRLCRSGRKRRYRKERKERNRNE